MEDVGVASSCAAAAAVRQDQAQPGKLGGVGVGSHHQGGGRGTEELEELIPALGGAAHSGSMRAAEVRGWLFARPSFTLPLLSSASASIRLRCSAAPLG